MSHCSCESYITSDVSESFCINLHSNIFYIIHIPRRTPRTMASVATKQREVFGVTPPGYRQFRILSATTKNGYPLSLRITHYGDDEYMVEGINGWGSILFDGGIRQNDNYMMLLRDIEREVMAIKNH